MTNIFPNIVDVASRLNPLQPLYMVQLFLVTAADGGRFYVIYIQDMLTFKLVDFKTFDSPVKYLDAAMFVLKYAKNLECLNSVVFVFLKITPFANQGFLNLMEVGGLNCSYYSRSETLKLYHTHKLFIKHIIMVYPDNLPQILNIWNNAAPQKLAELKLENEKSSP